MTKRGNKKLHVNQHILQAIEVKLIQSYETLFLTIL